MGVPPDVGRDDAGDDTDLGDDIVRAAPHDALHDRVEAVSYLRGRGREVPRVALAGYELERCIGVGGFGRVYLAMHARLRRRVAIKVLHPHRASGERLRREAHALAQLNHPNVVQVFEVGEAEAGTFIAMEYVVGTPLGTWQRGQPWTEVLDAYRQAALGLAAAHARGILHLDFKPTNALVGDDGRVRVVDFGLAGGPGLAVGSATDPMIPHGPAAHGDAQTRPQGGTLGYASPEQLEGATVSARSDQFSFCAALHEALHGILPYPTEDLLRLVLGPRRAWVIQRGALGCPRWIDRALRRGLDPEPEARWPSMLALHDALTPVPWHRRTRALGLVAAMGLAVPVSVLGLTNGRESDCRDVAEIADAWDADRREAIEAAIARTEVPYRDVLARSFVQRLDRRVDATVAAAHALCSTRRAGLDSASDGDLRRRCFDHDRARVDHVVTSILGGDVDTLEHAEALLDELGPPPACDGSDAAASDDAGQARIEAEIEIDRVRMDLAAARLRDADEGATRALALADQSGDAETVARAKLARGLVRDALGDDEAAVLDLEDAGLSALALGRDEIAAESWRRAAWIAGNDLEDLGRAERWARLARAALERQGTPPRAAAEQLDTEGALLRLEGDPVAAESKHRAALALLPAVFAPDDPRWIPSWLLLAHALSARGAEGEAKALYDRALELARDRLGALHPNVAALLLARAIAARELIAHADDDPPLLAADADLVEAALILRANGDRPVALRSSILTQHAEVALLLARYEQAERLAADAWALQRESLPPGHRERGSALAILAQVALARRDWPQALATHLTYASERRGVDDDAALAATDNNIGWLLCRLDRCAEARRYHRRAHDHGDPLQRAYADVGLGRVALALGDAQGAADTLGLAIVELEARVDAPPDLVAEAQWYLATARQSLGLAPAPTSALVRSALDYYRDAGTDELALAELGRLARALPAVAEGH